MGQSLNIFVVEVTAKLEVLVIQVLQGRILLIFQNADQFFSVPDQIQQFFVLGVVVEGNDGDAVLQLIEVGVGCIVN